MIKVDVQLKNDKCYRKRSYQLLSAVILFAAAAVFVIYINKNPNNANGTTTTDGENIISTRNLRDETHKIPHNIIFTYKHNILETREPTVFYENIRNTIRSFRQAWNEPKASVMFFDDEQCIIALRRVQPQLVQHFIEEERGVYKADICRIASLYLHGGYYFDIDMKVVTPPIFPPTVSFATVIQPDRHDFFQSFMASAPGHPILRRALRAMIYVYQGRLKVQMLLGTETLKWAYDAEPNRGQVVLLEEMNLEPHLYLDVPRQDGYGCCCNYVVHDPDTKVVHFYSRIPGESRRCSVAPL